MGEAKFTPGPWQPPHFVDDNHPCNCTSILADGYEGAIATIHIDNGKLVGEGGNDSPPLEEAKANARLIAAAPDLFEVLTALVDRFDTFDGEPFRNPADSIWTRARAALAKATAPLEKQEG